MKSELKNIFHTAEAKYLTMAIEVRNDLLSEVKIRTERYFYRALR
jgi:hypothetical protein